MLKIISVVGARPQFIKAAMVSRRLRSGMEFSEILIHTGQHYDPNLSAIFFEELNLPEAKVNLGVGSASHGAQTGKIMIALEPILVREEPDCVLVYGDTNSTLAGALTAAKIGIPIAHIEAGLRSFNRTMPEEINRVLTDHVSEYLFAPTRNAVENLKGEGIAEKRIFEVGDVMYDAALAYGQEAEERSRIIEELKLEAGHFLLATVHRAENTDDKVRLESIFRSLERVSRELTVVVPIHPRTRKALDGTEFSRLDSAGLRMIDPVSYLDMIMLEKNARLIATDSGGVQKEAFFFRVPCVTLREETEWVELVEIGWNRLAPPIEGVEIGEVIGEFLKEELPPPSEGLYGDGDGAGEIVRVLGEALSECRVPLIRSRRP